MRRKKLTKLVYITMIAVIFMSIIPLEVHASVSDISGYWAEDVILEWIEKGLAKGYSDGTFRPKNDISRAEFMELVNNAFGFTEEIEIDYKDVLEGKWYVSTIKKAKAADYISGYGDGTIRPDKPITREEVAAIITRIMNLNPDEKAVEGFKDKGKMKWSKGYIGAVTANKYMIGFPDGTFKPLKNITRGEAIFALNNIIIKNQVQVIAKQDFFGITYIRVLWDKGVKPSYVRANGQELNYDESDKMWKGTSLDLEIGDEVEILVMENGVENRMTVIVKDIVDD